jgi:dihydroxyacetone kinase-like protein
MQHGLTTETLKLGLVRIGEKLQECQSELNGLDGRLGDGDIGITMTTAFKLILADLDSLPPDIGMALFKTAQGFTQSRGSSFGTLLATGIMSAAKSLKGKTEVPWEELPDLLKRAIEAVSMRGKSELGDKTVLDALEAVRTGLEKASDTGAMLESADASLAKTLEEFRERPCRQGRARIFGEKSRGYDDPGMVVVKRMLEGLAH